MSRFDDIKGFLDRWSYFLMVFVLVVAVAAIFFHWGYVTKEKNDIEWQKEIIKVHAQNPVVVYKFAVNPDDTLPPEKILEKEGKPGD